MVKQVPATQPSMLGYLVKVDEVWVEDGDVVLGGVADVPELLHQLRLVVGVEDPVTLQDEPGAHDVLGGGLVRAAALQLPL